MTKEEMFEVFDGFDPAEHEDEAKERWGHTEAYKESARRTKGYTKADWERFKVESEDINRRSPRSWTRVSHPMIPAPWIRWSGTACR